MLFLKSISPRTPTSSEHHPADERVREAFVRREFRVPCVFHDLTQVFPHRFVEQVRRRSRERRVPDRRHDAFLHAFLRQNSDLRRGVYVDAAAERTREVDRLQFVRCDACRAQKDGDARRDRRFCRLHRADVLSRQLYVFREVDAALVFVRAGFVQLLVQVAVVFARFRVVKHIGVVFQLVEIAAYRTRRRDQTRFYSRSHSVDDAASADADCFRVADDFYVESSVFFVNFDFAHRAGGGAHAHFDLRAFESGSRRRRREVIFSARDDAEFAVRAEVEEERVLFPHFRVFPEQVRQPDRDIPADIRCREGSEVHQSVRVHERQRAAEDRVVCTERVSEFRLHEEGGHGDGRGVETGEEVFHDGVAGDGGIEDVAGTDARTFAEGYGVVGDRRADGGGEGVQLTGRRAGHTGDDVAAVAPLGIAEDVAREFASGLHIAQGEGDGGGADVDGEESAGRGACHDVNDPISADEPGEGSRAVLEFLRYAADGREGDIGGFTEALTEVFESVGGLLESRRGQRDGFCGDDGGLYREGIAEDRTGEFRRVGEVNVRDAVRRAETEVAEADGVVQFGGDTAACEGLREVHAVEKGGFGGGERCGFAGIADGADALAAFAVTAAGGMEGHAGDGGYEVEEGTGGVWDGVGFRGRMDVHGDLRLCRKIEVNFVC